MDVRTAQERAISRALANGGASCVRRLRYQLYEVESVSRPGTMHRVSVDASGAWHCSCEAGLAGRVCWHQASVYIAKVEHASGARVTGAATVPAPQLAVPANVVTFRQRAA
jgi:hypothetical protein